MCRNGIAHITLRWYSAWTLLMALFVLGLLYLRWLPTIINRRDQVSYVSESEEVEPKMTNPEYENAQSFDVQNI